jgi:hypothetical protein
MLGIVVIAWIVSRRVSRHARPRPTAATSNTEEADEVVARGVNVESPRVRRAIARPR